jgi:hypothetical protein
MAGRGPAVSVDEVMRPAVRQSVRRGLMWGGVVGVIGLAGVVVVTRLRQGYGGQARRARRG